MTLTTNNKQTFFDDWFGSQEARDKILPIADKGDAASTDDLIEMMKISFLAGAEAQKAITRKEIAKYLRERTSALSMEGIRKFADFIESGGFQSREAAREGSK